MKQIIRLCCTIVLVISGIVPANAQGGQDALFMFRNDDRTYGLAFETVDSIVFSKIAVDSTLHEEYVTQEIWTADSVYRVSIASIDSVTFKAPPTEYKEGVTVLDYDLWSYITAADSASITLSHDTPARLVPSVGDRLVTITVCETFPYGFAGEVTSTENTSDGIILYCDMLPPEDVIDRLYSVFEIESTSSDDAVPMAKVDTQLPAIIINASKGVDIEGELRPESDWAWSTGASLDVSLTVRPHIYFTQIVEYGDRFADIKVVMNNTLASKAAMYGTVSYTHDFGKLEEIDLVKIPIPLIPKIPPFVELYCSVGPFFSLDFNGAMETDWKRDFQLTFQASYSSNSNIEKHDPCFSEPVMLGEEETNTTLAGNMELLAGGYIETGVRLIRTRIKAIDDIADVRLFLRRELGARMDMGISLTKPELDGDEGTSTAIYDGLKENDDNSISGTVYTNAIGGYRHELLSTFEFDRVKNVEEDLCTLFEKSIVPTFANPTFNHDEMTFGCDISGDPLVPTQVGMKIFDEDGNEIVKGSYADEYKSSDSYGHYTISASETVLKANKEYKAYPSMTIFGKEILASPYSTFALSVTPVTEGNGYVTEESATLYGSLSGYTDLLDETCTYGFMYGESPELQADGTAVSCSLGSGGSLTYTLSGLKEGTRYYYCTFVLISGTYYYGETMSFMTEDKEDEAVDLGLSVKWRGWNLGATVPEEYGGYYAWGETETKTDYSWEQYFDSPYNDADEWTGSKMNENISGTEYDAATVALGTEWRMPTKEEMQELVDNCSWEWIALNGVNGYRVTSQINGNSIFLPAGGNVEGTTVSNAGQYGGYWTGTVNAGAAASSSQASSLYFFGSTLHAIQWSNRYNGRSIRPVTDY